MGGVKDLNSIIEIKFNTRPLFETIKQLIISKFFNNFGQIGRKSDPI